MNFLCSLVPNSLSLQPALMSITLDTVLLAGLKYACYYTVQR